MRIFVTGSIAYDYIMVFPGRFQDHILPDKMHVLSVSFLVDSLTRRRGGTGANIAYNLGLLGERPILVGAVGDDFTEYRSFLESIGVDCHVVKVIGGEHTASCFINTDLHDNQITAFYPGAMSHARTISLREAGVRADDLVLIAPNDPGAMNRAVAECTEAGIPYLYDPAMQLPRLTRDDLEKGCGGARILAGNDYEFGMMAEKLGITEADLQRRVPITVMTRGEAGSVITVGDESFEIPAAKCKKVVDPTGAGDAYRSGLVLGYKLKLPWPVVGRLASLTGVYAVEQHGPQQHAYTLQEFVARYGESFGSSSDIGALLGRRAPAN
jgi:adenosine kinase